jgi:tetratricopeptide (TPR) repeat protein
MSSRQTHPPILTTIQQAFHTGAYAHAGAQLAGQLEALLDLHGAAKIGEIVAHFPAYLFHENRDLSYVQGMVQARKGEIAEAIRQLERARFSYTVAEPQIEQAVRCSLELARLYCSRENFQTAYHHLRQHVQPWVDSGQLTDPPLRARFYLRMAELMPDIGRFSATVDYARQALQIYEESHDLSGQYFTLVRMTSAFIHLADYREADRTIALAKECLAVGEFGPLARARLLNLECHFRWHRGQLQEAIAVAQEYLRVVDQEPASNFRVYARILLANLHRDLGQFAPAEEWYAETRRVIAELEYHLYQPWIDAQEAWLHLLQGRLDRASHSIHTSLQTADLGQTMSFQVVLAVIYLVEGQWAVTERLLTESLAYYEQSGDELAACTIRFYLAVTALRQGEIDRSQGFLAQAFAWLAQRHVDYLPYWWHPPLLSEICAQALTLDRYADVVERIFLNHLRAAGKEALKALLHGGDRDVAQKAFRLLCNLGDAIDELVAHLPNRPAKAVLIRLLQRGDLCPVAYPRLEQELMTAMRRPKPNLTLMAIFGLYVNGATREEIAEEVKCSLPSVRNYITAIYEHFGVGTEGFATRRARWQRLVAVVKGKGFVR